MEIIKELLPLQGDEQEQRITSKEVYKEATWCFKEDIVLKRCQPYILINGYKLLDKPYLVYVDTRTNIVYHNIILDDYSSEFILLH
jgi:hypothetical protein